MLIAEKCVTECFFAFLKIDEKPILELQKQAAKFDIKKQKLGIFLYGKNQPIKWDEKKKRIFKIVKKLILCNVFQCVWKWSSKKLCVRMF